MAKTNLSDIELCFLEGWSFLDIAKWESHKAKKHIRVPSIKYRLAQSNNWLVLSKLRNESKLKLSNPKYAASYRLYTERLNALGAL
jgi:hypothetical protein